MARADVCQDTEMSRVIFRPAGLQSPAPFLRSAYRGAVSLGPSGLLDNSGLSHHTIEHRHDSMRHPFCWRQRTATQPLVLCPGPSRQPASTELGDANHLDEWVLLVRNDEHIPAKTTVLTGPDGVAAADHPVEQAPRHLIAHNVARRRVYVDIGQVVPLPLQKLGCTDLAFFIGCS